MSLIKKLLKIDGVSTITDGIGIFNKIRTKLATGLKQCDKECTKKYSEIQKTKNRIDELHKSQAQANRVLSELNRILGEEVEINEQE